MTSNQMCGSERLLWKGIRVIIQDAGQEKRKKTAPNGAVFLVGLYCWFVMVSGLPRPRTATRPLSARTFWFFGS